MIRSGKWTPFLLLSFFILSLFGEYTHALTITVSESVLITAQVNSPGSPGGGGGGGGGTSNPDSPTIVSFSGRGYPSSKVTILKDGVLATTTTVDSQANFSARITNLATGTYMFTVYTEDRQGRRSMSFSFPVRVVRGTTVMVNDILLSPTIDVDKIAVRRGDPIAIFGYAVPQSTVSISVHSDTEHILQTTTDRNGAYLYNFNTAPLELGSHTAQSKAVLAQQVSGITNPVPFTVGTENKLKVPGECGSIRGDLNCDQRVNLVDFSIMAFWYRKISPPALIDLSSDGSITLIDFSILAYNWTG